MSHGLWALLENPDAVNNEAVGKWGSAVGTAGPVAAYGQIDEEVMIVAEFAKTAGVPLLDELHRVMVHGLLHLLGYDDRTAGEKAEMTAREDFYLRLRGF